MTDEIQLRTPPQNLVAEQCALGGVMLSTTALHDVTADVQPGDFYDPRHELILLAVLALMGRGEPVDAITVGDELAQTGELTRAGGPAYLHELTGIVPTAANAGYYAGIVREKAVMRRLIEAGERIVQMGFASEGDPAALVEAARNEVGAASSTVQSEVRAIGGALDGLVDELTRTPRYVPTPWRELNDYIGGLRSGALYVVGARPGEGKTIMGLQLAAGLAHAGPVAFCSLEMSEDQLLTRLISTRARVHMSPLTSHALTDDDWVKVAGVKSDIERMPLYVDDRSGLNVTQIQAFARAVGRRGPIAGVVVDYLQLIGGGDRGRARHEVVGDISRQLKGLARELGCPVVALSQLNRESVGKQRRAPTPADLRESGAIEQDADVVLLLQRQLAEDDQPSDRLDVIVAKNRHGKTGRRTLLWEGQYARLTSIGWGYGGLDFGVPE